MAGQMMIQVDERLEGRSSPAAGLEPMICVVDDDASLLRALHRLLGGGGFSVATFASAEEFLEFPDRTHAACLVVDVHLGGCSGFELQEQLAATGSRIPILFITARDDAPTRERARLAGAFDYLRKPFDGELLLGSIRRATGRG
jgi:FixJ family two-component response regulator